MRTQYTPADYAAELNNQTDEAGVLVRGLDTTMLNWQPRGGKSWSIGQCLDHLVRTNSIVLTAMRAAVESNRDQIEARSAPIQAAGWFSRWFIRFIGPESGSKVPAPSRVVPASQVSSEVLRQFELVQDEVAAFVAEFKDAALGAIRYKNPLAPIPWTVDSGLLIFLAHNHRHLKQADRIKKNEGWPRSTTGGV